MHCVKIIYPRKSDTFFDFDHYAKVHLPLALTAIAPYAEVLRLEYDKGIGGLAGSEDLPYHCICSVYFADAAGAAGFRALFENEQDSAPVAADIPNYTNTTPEFQFSETIALE